ncbi:MAG TPA: hypothetical protein VFV78_00180 [Vicinamibacterales bacterium]|nr:hypothetical protein [Vicinamibacterales bacterium]
MDPRTEQMLAERAERAAAAAAKKPKTHATALKLLGGVACVVVFAAYYFVVALPAQRADQRQTETRTAENLKAATAAKHESVADCLTKAQAAADAQWTAACKARKQGPNCPLPEQQADAFDRAESIARNACLLGR